MSDLANSLNLLPPNRSPLEVATATVCVPKVDASVVTRLWNAELCPSNLLPWLAWATSVDEWDDRWDESTQRQAIAASLATHRKKGTVWAVKKALSVVNITTELLEWWQQQPLGAPYTFALTAWVTSSQHANEAVLDRDLYERIKRIVDQAKPVRASYYFKVGALFDQTNLGFAQVQQAIAYSRNGATVQAVQTTTPAQLACVANVKQINAVASYMATPVAVQLGAQINSLRLASTVKPLSVLRVAMEVQ